MHQQQDWLAQQTYASPQRVALIFGQEQWTFAELDQQVNRYAQSLKKMGLGFAMGTLIVRFSH